MTPRPQEEDYHALAQSSEEQLLEQLGMRSAVVARDLSKSAMTGLSVTTAEVTTMGLTDDFKALGRRILAKWNRSAFEIACGKDADDAQTREKLGKALGMGEAAAIGVISTALIGVGLMPALAPVLAAILVKKFFNPAYGEFCAYWEERLTK